LSAGKAGKVRGGDRLPWVSAGGADNFASLGAMTWQVHVYGSAVAELTAWCAAKGVQLHVYDWRAEHAAAGLKRDALYLLRPDSYVALADASGSPAALERYAAARGMRLGTTPSSPSGGSTAEGGVGGSLARHWG
jgi:hypothetical protein